MIECHTAGRGRKATHYLAVRVGVVSKRSLQELRHFAVLPFTADAESLFHDFRSRKIRVATHDLRIAAISIAHWVELISRNRRDFDRVPGLDVEYWP